MDSYLMVKPTFDAKLFRASAGNSNQSSSSHRIQGSGGTFGSVAYVRLTTASQPLQGQLPVAFHGPSDLVKFY